MLQGEPYILEPEITLTVEGLRHREVGQAHAWYYPADRVLMIRECYLLDHYVECELSGDMTLGTLWAGFERALLNS